MYSDPLVVNISLSERRKAIGPLCQMSFSLLEKKKKCWFQFCQSQMKLRPVHTGFTCYVVTGSAMLHVSNVRVKISLTPVLSLGATLFLLHFQLQQQIQCEPALKHLLTHLPFEPFQNNMLPVRRGYHPKGPLLQVDGRLLAQMEGRRVGRHGGPRVVGRWGQR